jgi:glycosyltransferase involved in cell wall biosynthesis
MSTKESLISIIIPIFKSESFLPRLINCLADQTFTNLQFLFVDDGSPDNSKDHIQDFARLDNRVKYIFQENQGAASALNTGLNKAEGEFIMFLDADDWIENDTCSVAMKLVEKFDLDMIFWLNIKEYEHKSIPYPPFFKESRLFENDGMHFLRRRMIGLIGDEMNSPMSTDAFNAGWGKLYRTEVIKSNSIQWTETSLVGSSDVLFNASVMPHVERAYFLHEYFHHYNKQNANSLTKTYQWTLSAKFKRLFEELSIIVEKYYEKKDEFIIALKNRIALSTINVGLSLTSAGLSQAAYKVFYQTLKSQVYIDAIRDLDIQYLPFHYKLYFILCKRNNIKAAYIMSYLMNKMRT